jgi:hypothetical protein
MRAGLKAGLAPDALALIDHPHIAIRSADMACSRWAVFYTERFGALTADINLNILRILRKHVTGNLDP